jgi:hypothetical protein
MGINWERGDKVQEVGGMEYVGIVIAADNRPDYTCVAVCYEIDGIIRVIPKAMLRNLSKEKR